MTFRVLYFLVIFMPFGSMVDAASLPGDTPLTEAFAEKLVSDELRLRGRGDAFRVMIDRPRLPLGNQQAAATQLVLRDVRHDDRTGRFSAVLIGTVDSTFRFQLPLEGRAVPLLTIPVLSRTIAGGDVVTPDDLDWITIAKDKLPKASLTDPAQMVGAEARRRLAPGRVLTSRDVGPPRLVRRGQPVRVVYADGGLQLTALGTARDDGGFGEPIRVINPESKLQLHGIATGPAEVTVGAQAAPGAGY